MLSLVLESLGLELPDLAVYHVAPQPAQGDVSVAACGALADHYFGVEDADWLAGLDVHKCYGCLAHVVAWRSRMLNGIEQAGLSRFAPHSGVPEVPLAPPPESPVALALRTELRRLLDDPLTVSSLRRVARLVEASTKTLRATAEGAGALLEASPPRRPPGGLGSYMSFPGPPDPDAVDVDTGADQGPYGSPYGAIAASPPIETFGSGMLREGIAAFMKFMERKEEARTSGRPRVGDLPPSPAMDPFRVQMLVQALASAKAADLSSDTIKKLEDSLAKALEEPKAASMPLPTGVEAFVSPRSVVVSDFVEPPSDDLAVEFPSQSPSPTASVGQA